MLENLSQMLVKAERATTAESPSSSTHRPKHFCGTLLASQHCSRTHRYPFRIRKTHFLTPNYEKTISFNVSMTTLPGQILLIHASVWDTKPSHGAPPKSSSCSLNRVFSLTPSPHVTEQSPSLQSLQRQSTKNTFWFTIFWRKIPYITRFWILDGKLSLKETKLVYASMFLDKSH